jgi:hypothetical protein
LINKKFRNCFKFFTYSHFSNKCGGWNKHRGGAKFEKSLNVEVGINVEGGILWKNHGKCVRCACRCGQKSTHTKGFYFLCFEIYLLFCFRFTEDEMKKIYRGFKTECPTGLITEEAFQGIYSKFFPHGGKI